MTPRADPRLLTRIAPRNYGSIGACDVQPAGRRGARERMWRDVERLIDDA
ncbi:MAG: hypothetical protein HY812_12890 [Planctomycetes bacterium]|nr:hypothetical protein [Planctomycetota bacterium]